MSIGVNKSIQNILVKSTITVGLTFGSMIATIMGDLFLGCLVGRILHPSTHKHNYYSCACDEPPTMTYDRIGSYNSRSNPLDWVNDWIVLYITPT